VLGAVGFFVGSFIVVGLFFALSFVQAGYGILEALSAAALGLVIGALLGLSLRSFRGTVVVALMGLVGFGIGGVLPPPCRFPDAALRRSLLVAKRSVRSHRRHHRRSIARSSPRIP
jgi:hypothetical protein